VRLSSDESDSGYPLWDQIVNKFDVRIFLDDVEQKNVVTADTTIGMVNRCKIDASGDIYAIGDEIAMEEVRGVVRIETPLAGCGKP
jgi:hypothetical protein